MAEQTAARPRDRFQLILSLIIGGVFIYAAVPKILTPQAFYLDILGYHLVGGFLAGTLAVWIPWLELLAAAGVIIGVWYLASLRILQGLLSVFTVLLFLTLLRGINTDCGCFGSAGGQVTWWHVFGDLVLLLITTFLISWTKFAGGQVGEEAPDGDAHTGASPGPSSPTGDTG